MMKHRLFCLFIGAAGLVGLATAQSSQAHSSSTKKAPDSLKSATAPLTPKSAMPKPSKSSAAPVAPNSSRGTSAELTHLERQNIKAGGPKSNRAVPAKVAPVKSADTSSGKIDFKYEKPAGGLTAAKPDARSTSTKNRVTKNN
jgi:hypothetical protein